MLQRVLKRSAPRQMIDRGLLLKKVCQAQLAANPVLAAELNLSCVQQKETANKKPFKYLENHLSDNKQKKPTAIKCQAPKKLNKDLPMTVQPSAL